MSAYFVIALSVVNIAARFVSILINLALLCPSVPCDMVRDMMIGRKLLVSANVCLLGCTHGYNNHINIVHNALLFSFFVVIE